MESINEDMLQLLVETGLVETDMTWAARVAVVVAMLLTPALRRAFQSTSFARRVDPGAR